MKRFPQSFRSSLLLLLLLALNAFAQGNRRPNIILILTDDQGYGDVGRHGNPVLQTPNLDRLHDESVRFTDFHVSTTCAPTRSALLSGRHDFKNGVTHTILERERMSLKTITLAQMLQSAGYTTGIFGKWHLGDEPAYRPNRRGFDEMFIHGCGGIGQTYPGSCGDAPGNSYFDPVILHNDRFEKTHGYCTDVFFGQAMQWMKAVKGRRPFFAYITPNAPHAPLDVPEQYEKLYAEKVPKNAAKFFGMVHNIDENVGRLLAMLGEQGIERDTLVIFMNDNGGTEGVRVWNAGMRAGKNTPYLGGTRAISFWRWPGRLRPAAVNALTAHVDVFPTLAELAGAKLSAAIKTQVEGRSLAPLLKDARASWPERIFIRHIGRWPKGADPNAYKYVQVSVRNPHWHLVNDSKENVKRWALYDVQADPGEQTDLAARHPDVVNALDAEYDKWWADVQPYLVNEGASQPAVNPYHEQYWKQFNGPGPNNVPPKPAQSPKVTGKPNILFLFADDMRADTIAAHGNPHIRTPNLDRLVRRGFSFRGNYIFGGDNGAVCVPSRAMLMSGKTWFHMDAPTLNGTRLLPEHLAAHGYATFGTGKWHNGQASWLRAFQRGKTVMFGGMSDHTKVPVRDLGPDGKLTPVREGEKFSSELFADSAIEFLRGHDGGKPFFAYVAFTAPHDPRQPPPAYREMYYRKLPPLPANFLPQLPFDNGMMKGGRDENLGAWPRTETMIRDQLAEYFGLITHMDEQIGRILAALEASGQARNTIVIFAADNGLALGSHGLLGKQSVFEHSMRTPLVIAGPGIPRGRSTRAFTYLLDLFPTLCDALGIPAPGDLEGESLRPLWEGRKARVRESVFLPYIQIQRAVRDERWKLIAYPKIGHLQLFDLQTDPYETTNLIARPDAAARVSRLMALMKQWQARVGDTLELPANDTPPARLDLSGQARKPDQWQPDWIVKKYFGDAR